MPKTLQSGSSTLLHISWASLGCCLKETGQELQLLHDYDMLMIFEKGTRGGISHISKRYAGANNKYMDNYDSSKPTTYIQYLDANNLYGWTMSQSLATHGFSWMKDLTIDSVIDLLDKKRNPEVKKGYIFEVDLVYPHKLWKSHKDLSSRTWENKC